MKLKPLEWVLITYQLFIILLCVIFKDKIINYKILIILHSIGILSLPLIFAHIKKPLLRIWYPVIFLPALYYETGLLNFLFYNTALDRIFIDMDKFIFREDISLTFCRKIPWKMFSEIMHFFYFSFYYTGILLGIYMWLKKTPAAVERFLFITIVSFICYYVIFIIFPVYGPKFYFKSLNPKTLKGYYFTDITNAILKRELRGGAFPSSHVGIAFIIYLFARNINFFIRIIYFIFFAGISISTVYCRAHYVVDVIAGIISGLFFYIIIKFIYDKLICDN